MEVNELRIGNYLAAHHFNFVLSKVDVIFENEIRCVFLEKQNDGTVSVMSVINEFKPIPLNEKWLFEFGFEQKKYSEGIEFIKRGFRLWKGNNWDFFEFSISDKYDEEYYNVTVKFVHQLQNLYFALAGEELVLKELV